MFLGLRSDVEGLLQRVREVIRNEVIPLEAEYHAEISRGIGGNIHHDRLKFLKG